MILDTQQQQQQQAQQQTPTGGGGGGGNVNFTSAQVVLQVGERYFGVSRDALQRHRGSAIFGQVLQQVEQAQKAGQSGVVSIQRNPQHFPIVAAYLGNGTEALVRMKVPEADLDILEQILVEAEFYQLPELVTFVKGLLKPELTREVVQHLLRRPTTPRDFTSARLVGLDLSKLDFAHIEIKGKESKFLPTVVHSCDFKPQFNKSNLQWTNFTGSVLVQGSFQDTKLASTVFTEADLTSSTFDGSRLEKTNFTKANLTGVNFQRVQLFQVVFDGAQLTQVNFEGTDASSVPNVPVPMVTGQQQQQQPFGQFGAAQFAPAIPLGLKPSPTGCSFLASVFKEANLKGANFSGCNLKGAVFHQCNLEGIDLSGSNLDGVEIVECNLSRATLSYTSFKSAKILRSNLSGATLNHANLTFAQLFSSNFHQAQLVGANLQCTELFEFSLDEQDRNIVYKHHASFTQANFKYAQLQGVDLHRVDCSGADFRDANLTNAVMRETKLDNANLEGAILKRRVADEFEANWVVSKKGKTMADESFRFGH